MKTYINYFLFLAVMALVAFTGHGCWTLERISPPCIEVTGISPSLAPFGAIVTITGTNFCVGTPELHELRIGNTKVDILEVPSSDTMRFQVPKGIGDGKISLRLLTAPEECPVEGPQFTYQYTATKVTTLSGISGDNTCNTCFNFPSGMDWNALGNIVVADKSNFVIREVNVASGEIMKTHGIIKTPGCGPVVNSANAGFRAPIDVEADGSGNIYVAELNNNVISLINSMKNVSQYAGLCQNGGISTFPAPCNSPLGAPSSLAKDGNLLYFTSSGSLLRVDATGTSCTINQILRSGPNSKLSSLKISRSRIGFGPVFVGDEKATVKIKSVDDSGMPHDLPMSANLLDTPSDLETDSRGNIFVSDRGKNIIFVVYTNGEIAPLAGTGEKSFFDNVSGLNAKFNEPWGLLLDEASNVLYVADSGNHVIRKITLE